MLKKIIRLVLCLIIPIAMMTGCNAPKKVSKPTHQETVSIDVNGAYTTKHDVALYLHTYHKLPKNFITKIKVTMNVISKQCIKKAVAQNALSTATTLISITLKTITTPL
nr:hypothetical protein [uncultured Sharpea sp.]